jgi:hypothetical protein
MVNRYSSPTRFCWEPFGTQWRLLQDDGTYITYIQLSKDPMNAYWVRYGELLERVFADKLADSQFMADSIDKFLC